MSITFEETERYTNIGDVTLHSNEVGNGPALLCFHGGGPGANAWDNTKRNLPTLAEHFQVILLDLPGYGLSESMDALEDETQDRMYARAIRSFMDLRNIERAHFYGTSMSGGPVLRLALDNPERTNKLVLKSPALNTPNLLSTTPPDGIRSLHTFWDDPTRDNMVKMMHLFMPRAELLTEDMIESRYQSAILERRAARTPLPPPCFLAELEELAMPVLVVWGHQDHMVPLDGALFALAAIPNVRVHIWGGQSGHFVEWEHVEEWNRLVLNFLLHD